MEAAFPVLLPTEPIDRDQMQSIQQEIYERAIFSDDTDSPLGSPATVRVAGVDQAFDNGDVISAVVVMENGDVIESVTERTSLTLPYIPGYLAFREGPPILAALTSLSVTPDVIIFDGNGRLHPRQAGIATHLGVVFDHPTVGVAKRLLCGSLHDPPDAPFSQGTTVPIYAEDDGTKEVGVAVQTKQWDRSTPHINPVYVSAGHRCSTMTSAAIVTSHCNGYKLPEPIRQADTLAGSIRDGTAKR